jgi:hypothetical protein
VLKKHYSTMRSYSNKFQDVFETFGKLFFVYWYEFPATEYCSSQVFLDIGVLCTALVERGIQFLLYVSGLPIFWNT